jgi:hypothetical protein
MLAADNFTGEAMRGVRACASIGAVALLLAATACRTSNLAFIADERLEIVSPEDRATVTLPFDLTWTVEDFEVVGADGSDTDDAGYFAVLIDTSPMPPGENPAYFARDDASCYSAPDCPDRQYLADRNIYLTRETTFPIAALTDTRPVDRPSARDDHEISVIMLNGKSERIGESVFRIEVSVDRGQA